MEQTHSNQSNMVESSIFIEIKEDDYEAACCLCTEGAELQNLLIDHLQSAHGGF